MSAVLAPLPSRQSVRTRTHSAHAASGAGRTVVRLPRAASAPAPGPRVYRRRRAVVAVFVAALVGVIGLAVGGGEASRSAAGASPMRSYLVQPGDTLWAIAAQHAGSMPMVDYVDVLVELNGGAQVRAGEWIVLP